MMILGVDVEAYGQTIDDMTVIRAKFYEANQKEL